MFKYIFNLMEKQAIENKVKIKTGWPIRGL